MKLTWKEPGLSYNLESIMQFWQGDLGDFWTDSLFYYYPEIKKEQLAGLSGEDKNRYLREKLSEVYEQKKELLTGKRAAYQSWWDEKKPSITEALSEAFDTDCESHYENMTGNITLNPIAPRYLSERRFDVFYQNSERGALGMALHEIIHFVWFDVWNEYFNDSEADYEMPHLKWILSEMAVEPIMRDQRLSSVNPYFEADYEKAARGENGCVYDCFYRMRINGEPVLETLYRMYRQEPIHDFMEHSYEFCRKYEEEIRGQMAGVL